MNEKEQRMKPLRIAYLIVTMIAVAAVFKYARMSGGYMEPSPDISPVLSTPEAVCEEEDSVPALMPVPAPAEPTAGPDEKPAEPAETASPARPVRPSPKPRPSPLPTYDGEVPRVLSTVDFDGDGIDDYTDILLGAKAEAERHPYYYNEVYEGGYPPDDIGVCTDLIWRAFRDAGYNLKEMLDRDIELYPDEYMLWPDDYFNPDLDFRRVSRLEVFFARYCRPLTIDTSLIEEWQPSDIVIYDGHIGIVSDIRRPDGLPYLIHNTDELLTGYMEEDALDSREILAHYRFDASIIPEEVLIPWKSGTGNTDSADNTDNTENTDSTADIDVIDDIDDTNDTASADSTDITD